VRINKTQAGIAALAAVLLLATGCSKQRVFIDDAELKRTRVVATLDVVPANGENILWCASFAAAWKELQNTVMKAPVMIEGADEFTKPLNDASLPDFPAGSVFAMAGFARDNITQRIADGLKAQFPDKEPPKFDFASPDDIAAYAYLQVQSNFKHAYIDNEQPLAFTASDGTKTPIRSFGVKPDARSAERLRRQADVIYLDQSDPGGNVYFAIDLCGGEGETQIIFARFKLAGTLQETIASACRKFDYQSKISDEQTLLRRKFSWA
jgi:hypothetical protein